MGKTGSHPYYTKLLDQTVADMMEPGESVGSPYSTNLLSEKEKKQVYFALTALEKKGIIYKESKGKYRFCNPLFGAYLETFLQNSFYQFT